MESASRTNLNCVVDAFKKVGLPSHEVDEAAFEADISGSGIGVFKATHRRTSKVWGAAPAATKRRTISGRATELLGNKEVFFCWAPAALFRFPPTSWPTTCRCDQNREPPLGSSPCWIFLGSRGPILLCAAMPQNPDLGSPSGPVISNIHTVISTLFPKLELRHF